MLIKYWMSQNDKDLIPPFRDCCFVARYYEVFSEVGLTACVGVVRAQCVVCGMCVVCVCICVISDLKKNCHSVYP